MYSSLLGEGLLGGGFEYCNNIKKLMNNVLLL